MAKKIILANPPSQKECQELVDYKNAIFEAECNCSAAICDISSAIGSLVSEEVSNTYL